MGKRASRRRRGQRKGQRQFAVLSDETAVSADDWDVGVVLVHGIGPQRPFDTLESWTPSIHQALGATLGRHGRVTSDLERCSVGTDAGDISGYSTTVSRSGRHPSRVLVTEAHWADSYRSRRLLGTLPWLARVGPAMVLPFMPDARDREGDDPSDLLPSGSALRFLMRLLSALVPLVVLAALPMPLQATAIAAGLAALIVMMTNHRFNFAGHVCMAADEEFGLDAVEERIMQVIDTTRQSSKRVVVVAHSQGGYLAHRALTRMHSQDTTLITVGSGLQAITTLRVMGSRPRYVIGCWGALLGTLVVEGWLLTHFNPGQIFSPFAQMGVDPGILFAGLVVGALPPDLFATATPESMTDVLRGAIPKVHLDWWLLGAVMAYLVLLLIGRRWGSDFVRDIRIPALTRTHWIDITTHHDLVGRLAVPELPREVEEKAVVVTGNAFADHVRYMTKPGITSWLVAEQIARGLGYPANPMSEHERTSALARSSRRHSLRLAALVAPLLFVATMALTVGSDPVQAMVTATPKLIWVALALSLFVWLADTRDSRQVAEALADSEDARTPSVPSEPRLAEAAVLIATSLLGALSALAVYGWLRELHLLRQGEGLVSVVTLWTVACLCLAAAVAAGYRPPPVKVTGILLCATLIWAVPAWQSMAPLYPRHFLPLGLPAISWTALSTLVCLVGFAPLRARTKWAGRLALGVGRTLTLRGR